MFTGIVEELGSVAEVVAVGESARFAVRGPLVTSDARHGDSISVNGVCLTVVDTADGVFTCDVMRESLDRSALGALRPGDPVNLERAATLSSRMGGHLVQGHVDGVGTVAAVREDGFARVLTIAPDDPALLRYVVHKGSISVSGVSLTVARVDGPSSGTSGLKKAVWSVDETYIRVAGRWQYAYRAIDEYGQVVDVYLSPTRDAEAAERFFRCAFEETGEYPTRVTTDKAACYPPALERVLPDVEHLTGKLVQQRIERDHQHLKGRTRPMRGFKTDRGARIVCRGHGFLRNLRAGFYDLGGAIAGVAHRPAARLTKAWEDLTTVLLVA